MPTITEGNLVFDFPDGWEATKVDDWSFYRNQFQSTCGGARAVDVVALDPDRCLWLIEIKDYRRQRRSPEKGELGLEIATKIRDTIVCLVAARLHASDGEREVATKALQCRRIRLVLHLEQPAVTSKLFPVAFEPMNVELRMKQLLRAIDPHPRVHAADRLRGASWTVSARRDPDAETMA